MISISKEEAVYILCPANFATGGPEALHQLCHELIIINVNAKILYVDFDSRKHTDPVHPHYKKYNTPYTIRLENDCKNILILPETYCEYLFKKEFSNVKKIVWWLSVTNFYITLQNIKKQKLSKFERFFDINLFFKKLPSINNIKRLNVDHIAHSYYSLVHLKKIGLNCICQISDYMNLSFIDEFENTKKQNFAVYNPVKNDEFLQKIIRKTPEIEWVAIQNMTPKEVAETMRKAKLYVDFGYHPGKERMPREACLSKCCLIIGKVGSARYYEDIPIPDQYRFEKEETFIPKIVSAIQNCIENYDSEQKNFENYRQFLLNEKNKFSSDVAQLFIKH